LISLAKIYSVLKQQDQADACAAQAEALGRKP